MICLWQDGTGFNIVSLKATEQDFAGFKLSGRRNITTMTNFADTVHE